MYYELTSIWFDSPCAGWVAGVRLMFIDISPLLLLQIKVPKDKKEAGVEALPLNKNYEKIY